MDLPGDRLSTWVIRILSLAALVLLGPCLRGASATQVLIAEARVLDGTADALADLLLINGNPLEDLSVLAKSDEGIASIMKDGKIYKNTVR
jgi:hypothetical protein